MIEYFIKNIYKMTRFPKFKEMGNLHKFHSILGGKKILS